MASPPELGRGLVLLGVLALIGDAWPWPMGQRVPAQAAGQPLSVRLQDLRGAGFRLLPGVGPVFQERLEAARVAAGGVLDESLAAEVKGVGPALLQRWALLRSR
jgi:hypothetical protein